jgi:hypothetical protein
MKKTIKIIFTIFSVIAFVFSVICIIKSIQNLEIILNDSFYRNEIERNRVLAFEVKRIFFNIFCCITNILFFCVVNFKDLQFIKESLIGMFKETEEKRKENKKQRLAKDIEKKQALLNEMQKDEE